MSNTTEAGSTVAFTKVHFEITTSYSGFIQATASLCFLMPKHYILMSQTQSVAVLFLNI